MDFNLGILDKNERYISGWASVEIVDKQNQYVPVKELVKAMVKYIDRGGQIFYGHENKPVGKVLAWEVNKHPDTGKDGVFIVAKINKGYKLDDIVWNMIKNGQLKGFSIAGFGGIEKQVMKDEKGINREVEILKNIELNEISIVDTPANPCAVISEFNRFAKGIKTNDVPMLLKEIISLLADKVDKEILEKIIELIVQYNSDNIRNDNNGDDILEANDNNPVVIETETFKSDNVSDKVEETTGKEEFESDEENNDENSNEDKEDDNKMVNTKTDNYSNPRYSKKKVTIKNKEKVEKGFARCYYKSMKILKKLGAFDWKNGINEKVYNEIIKKESRYIDASGKFKIMSCPDNPKEKNRFCGCIRYFMNEKGMSLERAKKMCGYIKNYSKR